MNYRFGAAIGLILGVFTACQTTSSLPGTSEGTFSVVGALGTNTCGTTLNAPSPWDYSVEVSEDGTTVYLQSTTDSNLLTGTLATNSATLTSVVTSNTGGADGGGLGSCNLTQTTTYTLTFDSGASPKSFTGSAVYTYASNTSISSTNDCSGELAAAGGSYATLPCTVNYTLTGTKSD